MGGRGICALLSGISWALEESPYRVSLYAVRDFQESQETTGRSFR